jgi:hypothetical protein
MEKILCYNTSSSYMIQVGIIFQSYSLHPRISVYLTSNFVHKKVYFSYFNALLSSKNCFFLITRKSSPIAISHFIYALSSLKVEKLKRREILSDTFSMQKSLFFLESANVHSIMDRGRISLLFPWFSYPMNQRSPKYVSEQKLGDEWRLW